MLHVIAENKYNEQLDLTANNNYVLLSVGGLTPPTATINTAILAPSDGAIFNSSRLDMRNIILTVKPLNAIEKNRINLYKYFKSKQYIKLYLENNTRSVWIDGYIEAVDGDLYTMDERISISIVCPDPYFKDTVTGKYAFSYVVDRFKFPFAIEASPGVPVSELEEYTEIAIHNVSDDETGVLITMVATGAVVNPTISASNVSIESDDTAGSIAYTVNDGVPGGAISAEITSQTPASWLTLGADSGTAIAFTCAANATSDPKTATVRITYTYDTDKTVYKDVTVTQKGAGVSESHVRVFYANASKTAVELLDGVSVSPLEYFTTGGSGADLGGDYSISSWTIGDYTSTKGWKFNSSGYVSFTTSATLNTTVRFYFVRRKTGDTTAQIQLLPDGGDAQVFDTPYDSIGDSGVIALAKNTNYTIKQKSKEQALLLVIVNETE